VDDLAGEVEDHIADRRARRTDRPVAAAPLDTVTA
jgi:hypothetical protein